MADDGESVYGNAASRVGSDDMTREGNTDRNRAIARARVLLDRDPVVIDTETTGVGPVAEVCEIAIVGRTGETVVDTLVRPGRPIPSEATRIHGITNAAVATARSFERVESDEFPGLLSSPGRAIATYNAGYDLRLLDQSSGMGGAVPGGIVPTPTASWSCTRCTAVNGATRTALIQRSR